MFQTSGLFADWIKFHAFFQGQDLTLQFLFFDGEEPFVRWSGNDNTYGSRHLAKVWQEKGLLDGIEVFMLLDLLGARNPKISPLDGKPHVCWNCFAYTISFESIIDHDCCRNGGKNWLSMRTWWWIKTGPCQEVEFSVIRGLAELESKTITYISSGKVRLISVAIHIILKAEVTSNFGTHGLWAFCTILWHSFPCPTMIWSIF